jgi:carotenoid cleavage dioxygenase-like enzyme
MPYALRLVADGELETLGRVMFEKNYDERVSAHPKIHWVTGELFSVSYSFDDAHAPATVVVVDKGGVLTRTVDINNLYTAPESDKSRRSMMHDSQVTESFIIVLDLPLVFAPDKMVKEGGLPIKFAQGEPSRFGLLPIDGVSESEIQWFTLQESVFIFHTIAAWEERDEFGGLKVILWACGMTYINLSLDRKTERGEDEATSIRKFVFDAASGDVTMTSFADAIVGWNPAGYPLTVDFPTIRPDLTGRPVRYCYLAVFERSLTDPQCPIGAAVGVTKFDMTTGLQSGKIFFGGVDSSAMVHGGEAVFVPRENSTCEDDGFLVTIVTDFKSEKSALHIYDALTMSAKPLVVIQAPCRLPSGFHSTFVPHDMLAKVRA